MRGTKIEQVACGSYHSVLLSHFGEVYTFGCGSFGRLGHGDHKHLSLPRIVASLRGKQIIKVSCGSWFTICLSDQGAVYSWGYNRFGQIGHGSHSVELLPRHITSFYGKKIVKLECGKHHTLFISDQNECFALGAGMCGQLGNRKKQIQLQPVKIEDLSKLKLNNIACGNLHSLALTSSGDIYMWGYISGDYLGLPETDEEYISAPKRMNISQIKNKIINIFAGGWHSAAITENGELYTWGFSDSGRLGIGNKIVEQDFHPLEPRIVEELKGKIIVSVACGSSHTLILALDT
jgi:alpha-tubulin suppressor-like RCC1 family protein